MCSKIKRNLQQRLPFWRRYTPFFDCFLYFVRHPPPELAMSTAAYGPLRTMNGAGGGGGGGSSTRSGQLDKTPATTSTTMETTLTFRLGARGRATKPATTSSTVGVSGPSSSARTGNSVGSSGSSDPVESDYSDDGDTLQPSAKFSKKGTATDCHKRQDKNGISASAADDDDDDSDDDEVVVNDGKLAGSSSGNDDDDADDDDDDDDDADDANNNDDDDDEEEDAETDDAEDNVEDTEPESSNSAASKRGARKYSLDDFQIIKTVGTGTFGRVCLCRDRVSSKYCAMKILSMADVIRLKQIEHVKNERDILREIKHPFVISLEWSTKDDCCLYMIFEYICGGELFSYLRNEGRFSSETSNFYAAEIVLALDYLHTLQIVYRDLKPENLLINRDGHLKITDFGFAKKLRDRTWTLCGTPEYLAPEIIQSKGHNRAVDWWALGVLIYEMLVGYPPFYDDNPFGIYEKILGGKIEWPRHMDPIAKDLVKKLLVNDRTKRLGNMKNGADDVKRHRWFKHLNWLDVYNKKLKAPIIPKVASDGDTSNFDDYPENDYKPVRSVSQREMEYFRDF